MGGCQNLGAFSGNRFKRRHKAAPGSNKGPYICLTSLHAAQTKHRQIRTRKKQTCDVLHKNKQSINNKLYVLHTHTHSNKSKKRKPKQIATHRLSPPSPPPLQLVVWSWVACHRKFCGRYAKYRPVKLPASGLHGYEKYAGVIPKWDSRDCHFQLIRLAAHRKWQGLPP